jgi:hypothetical protein
MLRKAKVCALDHLLLERFGGKVGRGRAVELSRGCDSSRCLESLFTPVLTNCYGHSGDGESSAETGHNEGANISLQ